MAFLSSGDATFRLLAKILRYVNILAQPESSPPPSRKVRRRPAGKFAAAQPLPPKPAGTNCRAVSRASRPAVAAEARRNELPSGVYASRLGNRYPRVCDNCNPQNRLSFRLRLSSMTALSSASRFNCAGAVYHPPAPPYVAKSIQSPPKSVASIGIPCKMLFDDASLSLLQRYDYLKVIDYSSYSKKEHPTLRSLRLKT